MTTSCQIFKLKIADNPVAMSHAGDKVLPVSRLNVQKVQSFYSSRHFCDAQSFARGKPDVTADLVIA
jgi:hypothetical protein